MYVSTSNYLLLSIYKLINILYAQRESEIEIENFDGKNKYSFKDIQVANFCCTSAMKMCTLHNILKVRYFRKKNSSNVKNHICKLFFFLMMEASDWLCSAKHVVNQSEVMMDQVRINWVLKVVKQLNKTIFVLF